MALLAAGKLRRNQNARVVPAEFGNAIFDWIAEHGKGRKFDSSMLAELKEKIILPLSEGRLGKRVVQEKEDQYRNLVRFWRRGVRRGIFPENEIVQMFRLEDLTGGICSTYRSRPCFGCLPGFLWLPEV